MSEKEEAIRYLLKVIELKPHNKEAHKLLLKIKN